jgi:hypothetical protein
MLSVTCVVGLKKWPSKSYFIPAYFSEWKSNTKIDEGLAEQKQVDAIMNEPSSSIDERMALSRGNKVTTAEVDRFKGRRPRH